MARSREGGDEEGEIWGTWEELLLACAVNRHGAHSWDSVAMELRSRSTPSYAHHLTPDLCRNRYRHLHLRFTGGDGTDASDGDLTDEIPWLDELRKLRVAELRQALNRSDVSIGTLQLKVKRLKEERERSLKEPESAGDGRSGSDPVEEKRKERIGSPGLVLGGGSDGSCRESNSTEKKLEEEPDPDPKAVTGSGSDGGGGEASYNGSTGGGAVLSPAEEANPVNESGESVAETKESSDVQSSASLSQRRRRRRGRRRMPASAVTVASDEPEAADAASSPVRKPVDSESRPLISFLDMIRSTKHGPVFGRRLESQESERYGSIIRRHVDLDIIQGRIRRSGYTITEFFRDLLLLCTNASVFFPKSSRESIAAVHIRDLVSREISTLRELTVPSPPSVKEPTLLPAQHYLPAPPNSDPKPNTSPPDKKPLAPLPPLVACRKRSSVTVKPAMKKNEKMKQEIIIKEKDEIAKMKKALPEFIIGEDEKVTEKEKEEEEVVDKKSTKLQRSALARGPRTNKTRSGLKMAAKSQSIATTEVPKEETEPKAEQETKLSAAKKRSAANFLNRMKRSMPSSSNGTLLDDLQTSVSVRGSDLPKKKSREESQKGKEKEKGSTAVKRTVGRPPKRMPTSPAKRRREEKMSTPKTTNKRARR